MSAHGEGLKPISQDSMHFYNRVGYNDYDGQASPTDQRKKMIADLGQHWALILRNHGLLVTGRTAAEAFNNIYYLERACQAQVAALSAGMDQIVFPPEEVRLRTAEQFNRSDSPHIYDLAWTAALTLMAIVMILNIGARLVAHFFAPKAGR